MNIRIDKYASDDITLVARMLEQQPRPELNWPLRMGHRWWQDLPVVNQGEWR
jgi:hypothetical protein